MYVDGSRGTIGAVLLVLVAALVLVPTACADTFTYIASDHPDGNQNPPPYGFRGDIGTTVHTFTFESVFFVYDNNSTAWTGDDTATLMGQIRHNQGSGDGAVYQIMASFAVLGFEDGFFDGGDPIADLLANGVNGNGIIFDLIGMELSGGTTYPGPLTWIGKANGSGLEFLLEFGHRGFPGVSGYGWLQTPYDGQLGINDFLFTLHPVPEPGTMVLLGSGLAALGLLRRRRVSSR